MVGRGVVNFSLVAETHNLMDVTYSHNAPDHVRPHVLYVAIITFSLAS